MQTMFQETYPDGTKVVNKGPLKDLTVQVSADVFIRVKED